MAISQKEQHLFNELHAIRSKQAEVLDAFAMRGIKQSVVDMYNQKAHFIYELLQNADDARACEVEFELYPDKLVFRHNGKERFTVSEEREDAKPYGHINAITAIGFSGKQRDEGNKIGKFGIGFKAIYQYCSTPEIYDTTFSFKIEKFIIPTQITSDYPGRESRETVFVFPFDQPNIAFNDIKAKLECLDNPILFLRHLQKVSIIVNGKPQGTYYKQSEYKEKVEDITHNLYEIDNRGEKQKMHLFTRSITVNDESKDNYYICVGYSLTQEGELDIEARPNVFCFFPTSEKFGNVCCITHAPFELVNSRQQLKETDYNDRLKELLANLAAEALPILRDYYLKRNKNIFDANILKIIPPKNYFCSKSADSRFREKYLEVLKGTALLITREKEYSTPENLLLVSNLPLANLISPEQLQELKGDNYHFIQAKLWRMAKEDYQIDMLLTETLEIETFNVDDFLGEITPEFMNAQSYDWVKKLYNHLHKKEHDTWDFDDDKSPWDYSACSSPIVKTSSGEWVTAYTSLGEPNVFLPLQTKVDDADYKFVNEEYLKEGITRNFLRNALHLTQPDSWSYIGTVIFQQCQSEELHNGELQHFFEFIYKYIQGLEDADKRSEKLNEVKKSFALLTQNDSFTLLSSPIYYDSKMLQSFMSEAKCNFIASDKYSDFIKRYGKEKFRAFLSELGVMFRPAIQSEEYSYEGWAPSNVKERFNLRNYTAVKYTDYSFPNFRKFADNPKKDRETSKILWSWLANESISKYRYANGKYRYYSWYSTPPVDSQLYTELRTLKWICIKDGEWVAPADIYIEDLEIAGYEATDTIIKFLEIKKKERDLKELGLTDEEIQRNRIGKMVEESGLTEDEIQAAISKARAEKAARGNSLANLHDNDATTETSKSSEVKEEDYAGSVSRKQSMPRQERRNTDQTPTLRDKQRLDGPSSSAAPENISSIEDKMKQKWESQRKKGVQRAKGIGYFPKEMVDMDIDLKGKTSNTPENPGFFTDKSIPSTTSTSYRDRSSEEISRRRTEAQNIAENAQEQLDLYEIWQQSEPYTFKWFKYLMELQFQDKDKKLPTPVQIDFHAWMAIDEKQKVLRVIEPSRNIPKWLEDAQDVVVTLLGKSSRRLNCSVLSVDGDGIELLINPDDYPVINSFEKIRINAQNHTNFIDSLQTSFLELDYDDDIKMDDTLPDNISFIYGPPGTGKTTRLVAILSDLLAKAEMSKKSLNILILTPTNKASDVIAEKLFDDSRCHDSLVRFGYSDSTKLLSDDSCCFQNRDTMDLNDRNDNIMVTTIARYAYDTIQPDSTPICEVKWDYIIVDEASMIDIVPITYLLHNLSFP